MRIDYVNLGKYAAAEAGLRSFVMDGKRSVRETVNRLQAIRDGRSDPDTPYTPPTRQGFYTHPVQQIGNLLYWNEMLNLGYAPEYLASLLHLIEGVDENVEGFPLVLCWTLNDLAATVQAKITIMADVYHEVKVTERIEESLEGGEFLLAGRSFEANQLWWARLGLAANSTRAVCEIDRNGAAGIEVLDAVCQLPRYVARTDAEAFDKPLPGLNAAGIVVTSRGRERLPFFQCMMRPEGIFLLFGVGYLRMKGIDDPHEVKDEPKSALPMVVETWRSPRP